MPQIKIRGIEPEQICTISKELVDNLTQIVGCPREYFVLECIHSTAVKDGQIVPVPPFVEVAWFDRGMEVQDKVAKEITRQVHSLGVLDVDLIFTTLVPTGYYENGEHF